MVAHALEIVRDLERSRDEAQVGRERLLQREESEAALLDVDLEAVDRAVVLEHLLGHDWIAPSQRVDRLAHDRLRSSSHEEQVLLQLLQLLLEVPFHCGSSSFRAREISRSAR